MLKKIFKNQKVLNKIDTSDSFEALKLMYEIAISDGAFDASELKLIEKKAGKAVSKNLNTSMIIKKIIDDAQKSVSFYPSIKKINDSYSYEEKIELLKTLWELVAADLKVDAYEESLYFKIAELLKIKRSRANQIKQEFT